MSKLLSIIIPTYNMERYLNRCLDSLLVGKKMELLEVLVINDGSKDRSSEIANEYENKYPKTFRVIDKENGNYGSCINCGLKEATGKYVKVLDADDSFDRNNLYLFLDKLKNTEADMILSDYVEVNESASFVRKHSFKILNNNILIFENVHKYLYNEDFQMHAVTYKRENLIDIHYKQSEGISYTDLEWLFMPMTMVKTVCYINVTLYKYLIGREGQTSDPMVIDRSVSHFILILKKMLNDYSKCSNLQTYISDYLEYRIISLARRVYKLLLLPVNTIYKKNVMDEIDNYIMLRNPPIYERLDNLPIHHYLPFKYIRYYRKCGKRPPRSVRYINKLMKNIQYHITYRGM